MRQGTAAAGSALFLALVPGCVAVVVPWWITGWRAGPSPPALPLRALGALWSAAGAAVLLHAFWRFVREGSGTPAPVAPTARLVVGGLYRRVRNPMYLAVVSAIEGQALALGSFRLAAYGALVLAVTAAFARWYEGPALTRRFGEEYLAYRSAVPGWWPRWSPWTQPQRVGQLQSGACRGGLTCRPAPRRPSGRRPAGRRAG